MAIILRKKTHDWELGVWRIEENLDELLNIVNSGSGNFYYEEINTIKTFFCLIYYFNDHQSDIIYFFLCLVKIIRILIINYSGFMAGVYPLNRLILAINFA